MHRRTDAAGLIRETRYDRGALLRSYVRPSDGALLVEGFAAREGVLRYVREDGTVVRELVTPEAIRTGAASLARVSVTLGHPPQNVTPQNYKEYSVGDVDGEVAIEQGGFTRVRLAVRDASAIQAVRSGTRELSCGYDVTIDPTPGVHDEYGAYDVRQLSRDSNHLAIVDRARAGPEARMRVDGVLLEPFRADAAPHPAGPPARGHQMLSMLMQALALLGRAERFDSEEVAGATLVDAIRTERNRRDGVESALQTDLAKAVRERDEARAAVATLTADRDAQRTRADAAEARATTLETTAKTRADADERAKLVPVAKRLGIKVDDHKDLPGLRRAIATASMPSKQLRADASDAYVQVLVDQAIERHADAGTGFEAGRQMWDPPAERQDDDGRRTDGPPPLKSENDLWAERVAAYRKGEA